MNDSERSWNLPTILVVILALFGLATIPQGQSNRPAVTSILGHHLPTRPTDSSTGN